MLRIDITEIAKITKKDSHASELSHIDTITSTLHNSHRNEQKLYSGEVSRKYSTSFALTTTNTFQKSQQVGVGLKASAGADVFLAKLTAELSANYGYNWGDSTMAGTTNTTTYEKTVTIPKQAVTLNPYTEVDITTEVSSQKVEDRYLVDANIDDVGFVGIRDYWIEPKLSLLNTAIDSSDMLLKPDNENLMNIVYDKNVDLYIVKRIPFIVERNEIVTNTIVGDERPFHET